MNVHLFSTGTCRITKSWQRGHGGYLPRLGRTLFDPELTEPLPIWCFLIEHKEGLILIDTGIPINANKPVWFPPFMRLVQRAAPFQIERTDQEIGPQLSAAGFNPKDVRWVVLTHLHQDHEGGLHHFPNAEFIVARKEWQAAAGVGGRMAGYLNNRWPAGFNPTLVDFTQPDPIFTGRTQLTSAGDVYLVPTPGHSAGHLSVIVEDGGVSLLFAGDASYSESLLMDDALDGVTVDTVSAHRSHAHIRSYLAAHPSVYLPSHEWGAADRLAKRQITQP